MFNATFSDISVIQWRSVLLVNEIGIPGENHRPAASHWQTLSHNVVSSTTHLIGFGFDLLCLRPLSAIFQLYHGDQFLVVEEAGVPGENHRSWASNW